MCVCKCALCKSVYVNVCMCVCVCTCVCLCGRVCVCMCMCVCTRPYVFVRARVWHSCAPNFRYQDWLKLQIQNIPRRVNSSWLFRAWSALSNAPPRPYLRQFTTCSHWQFRTVLEDCFATLVNLCTCTLLCGGYERQWRRATSTGRPLATPQAKHWHLSTGRRARSPHLLPRISEIRSVCKQRPKDCTFARRWVPILPA